MTLKAFIRWITNFIDECMCIHCIKTIIIHPHFGGCVKAKGQKKEKTEQQTLYPYDFLMASKNNKCAANRDKKFISKGWTRGKRQQKCGWCESNGILFLFTILQIFRIFMQKIQTLFIFVLYIHVYNPYSFISVYMLTLLE